MNHTLSLDKEWIELIIEAKEQGLTIRDIRDFLLCTDSRKSK